jgi:K+-transporting ATPase ATPase A chain
VTTDASCGAINSWHDSGLLLGGPVPLVNIMLGEVIFGGVGAGMYGTSSSSSCRCSLPA